MTEDFVLKKLEEYEKVIIALKEKNKELEAEIETLKKSKKKKRTVAKPKIELNKIVENLNTDEIKETKWNINLPIDNGKTVTVTGVPEGTVNPNNKIYVKSAERELTEMIGEES